MAIIDLQRRIAEVGRIRIGAQVATRTGANRPAKLDTFRLTSADRTRIEAAARLYGGEVHPWKAPAGNQWEVITGTDTLPVLVPPSDMAFSQWHELWSRAGCQRRCDGQTETISDGPCLCDPDQRECAIHTRLSVLLRDVPGWGIWRLESQGYYAAVELAGAVDLLKLAAEHGQIIPAVLRLEQRAITRPDVGTRRFAVPVLDPGISLGQLWHGSPAMDGHALPAPSEPAILPHEEDPIEHVTDLARTVTEQITAIEDTRTPVADDSPIKAAPPPRPAPSIADQVAATNLPTPPKRRGAVPLAHTGLPPRTTTQATTTATPLEPAPATTGPPHPIPEVRPAHTEGEGLAPPTLAEDQTNALNVDGTHMPVHQQPANAATDDPRAPGPGQLTLTGELPPEPPPADKLLSPRQQKKLMALLAHAGFTDHDTRIGFLSAALNTTITTTTELTSTQANHVIDILEHDEPTTDEPPDDGPDE